MFKTLACLLFIFSCTISKPLLTKERAEEIKKEVDWKVADPETGVFKGYSKKDLKDMMKTIKPPIKRGNRNKVTQSRRYALPSKFDGKTEWGKCIHTSTVQGKCGGCWAFGIVNHLSDRFCLWGKDVMLSVQDLLECTTGNSCCEGGVASNAYYYLMDYGAVALSDKDYDLKCGTCRAPSTTSSTRYRCVQDSDWWSTDVTETKREIYNNGPVMSIIDVYDDFPLYESGVYVRKSDVYLGVHSIEVLGWGVENGVSYWQCKNSWGSNWGDSGFFKIKMGECGINEYMNSCEPLIDDDE